MTTGGQRLNSLDRATMRLGRKKNTSTIELDGEQDDSTITSGTSGFSLGANSVSDR